MCANYITTVQDIIAFANETNTLYAFRYVGLYVSMTPKGLKPYGTCVRLQLRLCNCYIESQDLNSMLSLRIAIFCLS